MRSSNVALRLHPTLLAEAREFAKAEGVALDQIINVAVAQMIAVNRTAAFFERYTKDADIEGAIALLNRPGRDDPPMPGDELPEGWEDWKSELAASKPRRRKPVSAQAPVAPRRRATRSKSQS